MEREMANISHGMNVVEVERLGADLQTIASDIAGIIKRLEKQIGTTTWVGNDANRFKNDWWPGHRSKLTQIQNDLHGFGQSAKNNAREQRDVSDR
jgi:hypothetical protein